MNTILQYAQTLGRYALFGVIVQCLAFSTLLAQDTQVSGTVTDDLGESLPGANVVIKGTTTGTITDLDGKYSIGVPGAETILRISSVGFESQDVLVGSQSTINIQMAPDVAQLEEIVVVGYGEQKKATVTGSVASVGGEALRQAPSNNVSNSLVGQVPGLMIVNRSGEPGADDSQIRVRGINSLNNSSALIVIDGIANRDGGLARLNPNDIESITVLKDASAAIYGAQAANGVIMVTTKRGKSGAPELSLNLNQGLNNPTRMPDVVDAPTYATMLNELDDYAGRPHRYTDAEITKYGDGSDPWLYPNTDWYGAVIRPWTPQSNANLSLSGGNEDGVTYFISAGGTNEDGYYKNSASGYKQYNMRANIDAQIKKNVKFRFDVAGRQEKRQYTASRGGSIFRFLIGMKPTEPAFWPQRSTDDAPLPGPDFEGGNNPAVTGTDVTGYLHDDNYVFQSNAGLDFDNIFGVEGLSAVANVAIDESFRTVKRFKKPWTLYTWNKVDMNANGEPDLIGSTKGVATPELEQSLERKKSLTANFRVNYVKNVEDHGFGFMAGVERQTQSGNYFSAYRNGFVSSDLDQMNFGADNTAKTNSGWAYESARLNYFGRINYAFKDRYMIEGVWRYDGSQIFDPEFRWGFFPGVSAGWVISEESFMSGVSAVSRLKLRGSYGTLGNDRIDPYQYLALFEFGGSYIFNETSDTKSIRPRSVANQGVSWEVAKNANIGIDGAMLDGKLNFEFDVFKNVRTGILFPKNAAVPLTAGFSAPDENIGEVENKGFDFAIGYGDEINSDLSWSVGFNGGYAKNKILFWDEPDNDNTWQLSTGHPIGTDPRDPNADLYYNAVDVFKDQAAVDAYPSWPGAEPGDVRFEDVNGDGEITTDDRVRTDKSNFPRFTGGVTLGLTWKNFDLTALFQGSAGAQQYVRVASGEFGNYLQDFADGRWTASNPNSEKPRAYNRRDQYWVANNSTYFLKSTDYIRLKNLKLAYTLPQSLLEKAGINYTQVYVSGMNLITWDKLKVFDPETVNQGGEMYPQRRLLNIGVNLTF